MSTAHDTQPQPPITPPPRKRKRPGKGIFFAAVIAVIAGTVVGSALIGIGQRPHHSHHHHPAGSPAHTAPSPAGLTFTQRSYVDAMRQRWDFTGSVSDIDILTYGRTVCAEASAHSSQAHLMTLTRQAWSRTGANAAYRMVRMSESGLCPAWLPPLKWHTNATFTGSGATSTTRFRIHPPGNWVMRYSYDCSGQPGGEGNFIVDEDDGNDFATGAIAINRLDSGGHGSWHVYGDTGRHSLQIDTECPYTITVMQKY